MQKKTKMTYEERRDNALAEGKRYTFVVCPLCLRGKPAKEGKAAFKTDPNPEVIQIRMGVGGRGVGGFFKKEDESVRLNELKDTNPKVYYNLQKEIGRLYDILHRVQEHSKEKPDMPNNRAQTV